MNKGTETMAIRNITMNKTITTLLALVSILLFTSQAWSGRLVGFDYNVSDEVVCDYIYDPWTPTLPIIRSYTDMSGSGGGGRVHLPQITENCVGDSSGSVGGVAPPYVPPEGVVFAASVVTYYHNDALGSPVAATKGDGEVIWREEYRPYGTRLIKEDEGTNEDWFTGKPHEEEFGLSYFGARWYDPESGRFMGVDPVGVDTENPLSFGRYIYAYNNPYRYIDPDGRVSKLTTGTPSPFNNWQQWGGGTGGYSRYSFKPAPNTSISPKSSQSPTQSAPKPKGMNNPKVRDAAARGREAHREFSDKVKQKEGWKSEKTITGPNGEKLRPDALTPGGRPVELKPNTPSGRKQGAKQIKKYKEATGTNGRVIYYDPYGPVPTF